MDGIIFISANVRCFFSRGLPALQDSLIGAPRATFASAIPGSLPNQAPRQAQEPQDLPRLDRHLRRRQAVDRVDRADDHSVEIISVAPDAHLASDPRPEVDAGLKDPALYRVFVALQHQSKCAGPDHAGGVDLLVICGQVRLPGGPSRAAPRWRLHFDL